MRVMYRYLIASVFLISLILLPYIVLAQPQGSLDLGNLISEALKNPRTLAAIVIQFLMGLGLGYFSVKVLKYILALIVILILGSVLSVWSIGSSPESFLGQLYEVFRQFQPQVMVILQLLGIMTIGPVTLGFIVGVLVAVIRK